MKGNRNVNPMNLKRISESMKKNCLFSPILVNDKMEIIDGQHRLLALKEQKKEVYFIIVPNYSVNEVHILNTNSSNWKKEDYLLGYVDMGLRPYIQFKQLWDEFSNFGIKTCLAIISYHNSDKYNPQKSFESGNLTPFDLQSSINTAKKISDFKKFYEGYTKPSFAIAIMQCLKNDFYEHSVMMAKLSRLPKQITDQTNAKNYLFQLEEIYNYKNRKKVNFRF